MKQTSQQLGELLKMMIRHVEAGDSFEGNISYSCMEDGLAPNEFEVNCCFRIGNREGQGSMVVIDRTNPESP